ncbi:hypothetical protein EV651_117150 [Kribbella sp. VKM Ac-2571]|nr:hypothetical protein EV651_117150 [Kribbella sp. VKM Ac-2571]
MPIGSEVAPLALWGQFVRGDGELYGAFDEVLAWVQRE